MTTYSVSQAAGILGVSTDTVRRWLEAGRIASREQEQGQRRVIDGADLADLAASHRSDSETSYAVSSARNRLPGIVTEVIRDTVMAQVSMVCGPYRVVSLMSREAADELGLEKGVRAVASVKSTNVIVEKP